MNYFSHIIGQHTAKSKLSFLIEGYYKTNIMMPVLLTSKRGAGKTEIARSLKPYLKNPNDNTPKKFIEINGASLQKVDGLVQKAFVPFQGEYITYFIDEAHAMDSKVHEFFLSILAPNETNISRASHDGEELEFDYRMQTFIFATTDPQKLSSAFKTRCSNRVDLDPYSDEDIGEILRKKLQKSSINISEELCLEIAKTCRNTPREASITMNNNIQQYCSIKNITSFNEKNWAELKKILNIRPLGINNTEYATLKLLKESGGMTLTNIANSLSLRRSTIQGDVEPFLMEKKLIKVDGKRYITSAGLKVLESV